MNFTALLPEPGAAKLVGVKDAVKPTGNPVTPSATVELKPPLTVTLAVTVPVPPDATVTALVVVAS